MPENFHVGKRPFQRTQRGDRRGGNRVWRERCPAEGPYSRKDERGNAPPGRGKNRGKRRKGNGIERRTFPIRDVYLSRKKGDSFSRGKTAKKERSRKGVCIL